MHRLDGVEGLASIAKAFSPVSGNTLFTFANGYSFLFAVKMLFSMANQRKYTQVQSSSVVMKYGVNQ